MGFMEKLRAFVHREEEEVPRGRPNKNWVEDDDEDYDETDEFIA